MEEEIIIPEEETFDYNKLRYILDKNGYVCHASLGGLIICDLGECTEYNGEVPNGYLTIEEWLDEEIDKLNAWKVVEGNLEFDSAKYEELQKQYEQEAEDYRVIHKCDLFEINEKINQNDTSLKEQYKTNIASGKIVELNDANTLSPNIKITNINCYDYNKIKLISSNKNLLPNTATSQTLYGVDFTQNIDRSITINGKATENIEYNIAGTNTNISPILVLKKDVNYYLSSNGYQIKMYYYDGTDRTEIYSGTGGSIKFTDEDKKVTQVTLMIPKNKTIEDVTIYPQLEIGTIATDYITHKEYNLEIEYDSISEKGLFPSNSLYPSNSIQPARKGLTPSETLTPSTSLVPNNETDGSIPYPCGEVINYIRIENDDIYICRNDEETYLKNGFLGVLSGFNNVYATEDVDLEITYYNNVLNVDNLDFLCGKETTNKQFKVLDDASIQVNNIYMYNGAKIIGGKGLMSSIVINSNLISNAFVGASVMLPMGYSPSGEGYVKDRLEFQFTIPKGFSPEKAYITLNHVPTNYQYSNGGMTPANQRGYSRNLKLYKAIDYSSGNLSVNFYSSEGGVSNNFYYEEIYNAFGSNGFTGSENGYSKAISIDIKDNIEHSDSEDTFNIFKIETGNELVTSLEEMYAQSGSCNATLTILGYMPY